MAKEKKAYFKKRREEKQIAEMLDLPDPHPRKPRLREINARQAKLIEAKLAGASHIEAAKAAGYTGSDNSLTTHTSNLLHKSPAVVAVMETARKVVAERIAYTAEKAMLEAERGMEFAEETGNANAFVKAVELRAKLQGLLIEKYDVRMAAGFMVNITGINHKKPGEGNSNGG